MCDTCGCGDTTLVSVEVQQRLLAGNDRIAAHNRAHLAARGVLTVNLMGSPGAGKTALLEATARTMGAAHRLAAITGDLETDRDARRFPVVGVTAEEPSVCLAGLVLRGRTQPSDCPVFGTACTPDRPLGAPMVLIGWRVRGLLSLPPLPGRGN